MPRTALVISGGGSKGAFAIGVLDYLYAKHDTSPDITRAFDIVVGTSTGALIAPFVVADLADMGNQFFATAFNEYLYTGTDQYIDPLGALEVANGAESLYSTEGLRSRIDLNINADVDTAIQQAIADRGAEMYIVTTCLQSGQVVFFRRGPGEATEPQYTRIVDIENHEHMNDAIHASANMPVLMEPIVVHGGEDDNWQYVDGGVREYASLRVAVDNGAERIYAIYMSQPPEVREARDYEFTSAIPTPETTVNDEQAIVERTLDLFLMDVFENDRAWIQYHNDGVVYLEAARARLRQRLEAALPQGSATELEAIIDHTFTPDPDAAPSALASGQHIELHEFYPPKHLDVGTLEVEPHVMVQLYEMGWNSAKDYFEG